MEPELGYIAAAPGGGPGVLVLHAWWGLSDGIRHFCDRLADEGFVALAPDLAAGRTASTIPEAEALVDELDEGAAIRCAADGLARLRRDPRVRGRLAIVGFSMGVWFALDLATRYQSVGAVVLYYGTASDIDHAAHRASVLGHFAEHDEFEPLEEVAALRDELRRAGRAVEFHTYPGVSHWFAEADRPEAYDAVASSLAFRRTLELLRTHRLQDQAAAPPKER